MKHDFRLEPDGEAADRFRHWLESETTASLQRSNGDQESLRSAIFLYLNRAYEAHLPDKVIGGMFGQCFVRAGLPEEMEEFAFDELDQLANIVKQVHEES